MMSEGRSAPKTSMMSRLFILLTGVEGLFVIWWILQSPSEASSARLFGLSDTRLLMLGFASAASLSAIGLFAASWWKHSWFESILDRLKRKLEKNVIAAILLGICVIGILGIVQSVQYTTIVDEPVVEAFLYRLQPFLVWFALVSGQLLIFFSHWHFPAYSYNLFKQRDFVRFVAIFGLFLAIWIWLANTGYGFAEETPERGIFRELGTPLIGIQVALAAFVSLGVGWLIEKLRGKRLFFTKTSRVNIDLILGLLIWAATFAIWMSAPLKVNWFVDVPRPPNYTYSPNSDAYLYDAVGQSV